MPTRYDPKTGQPEKVSHEEATKDCREHIEKLNEQGVKWEDLGSGYGAYKSKEK